MKKVSVPRERFEGKTLFVATPMYGGMCVGSYVNGLLDLNTTLIRAGFNLRYYAVANESLVTRARNYCVAEFLLTDCTHFMFIDADIGFRSDDVISLLLAAEDDKDVVCGLYPKKSINWTKVGEAARNGASDEELSHCGANLAFNPINKQTLEFDDYELVEVESCGAGFMMIQRRVFENVIKAHPEKYYRRDGFDLNDADKGNIHSFFETAINEHGYYLSEDFYFCDLIKKLGMKVWAAPWIQLHHFGHYRFKGNLQTLSVPAETAAEAA